MEKEIWKSIVGYEGLYEVSNKGRVRSLDRYVKTRGGERLARGKLLIQSNREGYRVVNLSKGGASKSTLVHRIVAETFLPNPDNLPIINHKDEVRSNNCVENLEWCDKSYNQLYSLNLHPERAYVFGNNFKDKETGESLSPMTKSIPHKWFKPINQKTKDGIIVSRYENTCDLMNRTNYDSGFVVKCCNGIYKSAYGYRWEWAS